MDAPQVFDQLSLVNVAHNIHYKFEQEPLAPDQLRVYTQRLLKLLGYPTDEITTRAALETWQRIYPDEARILQSPPTTENAAPQLQAPASTPTESYQFHPAHVAAFPPPVAPPSPDDEWGGDYWHVQEPVEYPPSGTPWQDAFHHLVRDQGFGMMDALEWLQNHLSPDKATIAKSGALDWSRGTWGRGFQDPEGNFHTWSVGDLGSKGTPHHREMAEQLGLSDWQNPIIVAPSGQYTHNTPNNNEQIGSYPDMAYVPDYEKWHWRNIEKPSRYAADEEDEERHSTIPTQVNNPEDHWPEHGERSDEEIQHRELVFDHDQVWNRTGAAIQVQQHPLGSQGGYWGRRPIIWDSHTNIFHVAPEKDTHRDIENRIRDYATYDADNRDRYAQGWVGPNPEIYMGGKTQNEGQPNEVGWYEDWAPPSYGAHRLAEMLAEQNAPVESQEPKPYGHSQRLMDVLGGWSIRGVRASLNSGTHLHE